MKKYHYNKDTGRTGQCDAKVQCRLGLADSEHFDNAAEARTAFENTQETQVGKSLKKKNQPKAEPKLRGVIWNGGHIPDVNGIPFEKVWNERFSKLDDVQAGFAKEPKSQDIDVLLQEPVSVMRPRGSYSMTVDEFIKENPEYADNSFKGDYIIAVSARQGGGNRECYCDYSEDYDGHEDGCLSQNNDEINEHPNLIADKDDDFDRTYNTFYFDNGITKEKLEEYEKNEKSVTEIKALDGIREHISRGSLPPWIINANEQEKAVINKYNSTKNQLSSLKKRAKEAQESYKNLDDNLKKLAKNDDTADFSAISRVSKNAVSQHEMRSVKTYFEEKAGAEKYEKMIKEAESLPDDSDLKNYLIGNRGQGSYNATEKQGRRNVQVRRVYDRGSLLGEELKGYEKRAAIYKKNYDSLVTNVRAEMDVHKEKVNAYSESKKEIESLRNDAWAAGWTGDMKDIPEPHSNF